MSTTFSIRRVGESNPLASLVLTGHVATVTQTWDRSERTINAASALDLIHEALLGGLSVTAEVPG